MSTYVSENCKWRDTYKRVKRLIGKSSKLQDLLLDTKTMLKSCDESRNWPFKQCCNNCNDIPGGCNYAYMFITNEDFDSDRPDAYKQVDSSWTFNNAKITCQNNVKYYYGKDAKDLSNEDTDKTGGLAKEGSR